MEHLEINKAAEQKSKRDKLAVLQAQHISKTKYERIKPFAEFLNYLAHFCQTNSFALAAVGSCAALWFNMGSNGVPFMIFCIIAFAFVEVAVMLSMKTHSSMKYDDKVVSPVIYVGLVISLGISTPTTYYTTPYALRLFTANPTLVDTANVRIQGDIKIKTDTSFWHSQKVHQTNKVLAYWNSHKKRDCPTCEWRLSTIGTTRETYDAMLSDLQPLQDSINTYLARGEKEKDLSLKAADAENKVIMAKHFAWCESFGLMMALISLLAMFLLIPCRYYYEYWERNYAKELEADIEYQENKEKEAIQNLKDSANTNTDTNKESNVENVTDTTIETPRTVITAFETNKSTRNCTVCGTDISEKRSDAIYCGDKCRVKNHKSKNK